MQSTLYVALSAQLALQERLDTIAQNVANGTTAGYRANEVKFESVLSNTNGAPVAFVSSGSHPIRRTAAELVKTGNPLDVAIKVDGWLSVPSAQGLIYTRDGRMQMNAAGSLVTLSGAPILDAGARLSSSIPMAASLRSRRMEQSARAGKERGFLACSHCQATPSFPGRRGVSRPMSKEVRFQTSPQTGSCKAFGSSRTSTRSRKFPSLFMSSEPSKALAPRCNLPRQALRMPFKRWGRYLDARPGVRNGGRRLT